jgi:hypothetical protein
MGSVLEGLNKGRKGREDTRESRGIMGKRGRNVKGELFLYKIGQIVSICNCWNDSYIIPGISERKDKTKQINILGDANKTRNSDKYKH